MSRGNDHSDNSFQSGVFGLVLGFLAGAAAVILSDPEKRDKVKEKTAELVDNAKTNVLPTVVSTIADTVKEKTDQIQASINKSVTTAEDKVIEEIDKIENKEV